jgi:hexulose-6-phosphate isomerase
MPDISIMQGRLSPPQGPRVQFFPQDWKAEFSLAKDIGFSGLTWFLDRDIPDMNPVQDIWEDPQTLAGIDEARKTLPIHSIDCGRTFLFGPELPQTRKDFAALLPALAGRLRSRVVVVPMLIEYAPRSHADKKEAQEVLRELISIAEPLDLRFGLETDMPANELAEYVDSFDSTRIGVCYDLGSAVTLGFDVVKEIESLGNRIIEVHLKDHKKTDVLGVHRSARLGQGDVDFAACFGALRNVDYRGGYTLQAFRGEEYLEDAGSQLQFVRQQLHAI